MVRIRVGGVREPQLANQLIMWNVWYRGQKLNSRPLNEQQARKMAQIFNFNYAGNGAKPVKTCTI